MTKINLAMLNITVLTNATDYFKSLNNNIVCSDVVSSESTNDRDTRL